MQMRYGFNEVDGWWPASRGPGREMIRRRLRLMHTEVVRIFAFDKPVPDPISDWQNFAAQIRAILEAGAVPMVTFAKFHPPHDDPRALRAFAERCEEVAWGCLEEWGGAACAGWLWCIWNEPNNYQVGGALAFERYRVIYEEVAERLYRLLSPALDGRKVRIGGPAACGLQPYWSDGVARLLTAVESRLVRFALWPHWARRPQGIRLALIAAFVVLTLSTNVLVYLNFFRELHRPVAPWRYYVPKSLIAAGTWLDTHAQDTPVVLASNDSSQFLPRLAHVRVVSGQDALTPNYPQRNGDVLRFFGSPEDDGFKRWICGQWHVDYILVGPFESQSAFKPEVHPWLKQVYAEGGSALYQVAAP